MIFSKPPPFVTAYLEALDEAVKKYTQGRGLTRIQKSWLGLCVMGILNTNSVCWARFERACPGKFGIAAMSWMFRQSRIPWRPLLRASVTHLLTCHGIKRAILTVDDSDRERSKNAFKIGYLHKLKDKSSGGYSMGQCIVFLVLVTDVITIPVDFAFYVPDPNMSAWKKENARLKKLRVPPARRPPRPARNEKYPTKQAIATKLLARFRSEHPNVEVKAVLGDALYGMKSFLDDASFPFGGVQVISELRKNQKIRYKNKLMHVSDYFAQHPGSPFTIRIRAGKPVDVVMNSARLHVHAHGEKRFVIALKYEGEEEYRYLVASNLSWRTQDIVEAYTFRWLVEVFFEDWKSHEGWGRLTKHTGEEGSRRSLILSLLTDHCLLLHPDQKARLENKLPAYTVGSLRAKVTVDGLLDTFLDILNSDDPIGSFERLRENIKELFTLNTSTKHMVGRDLGRLDPTPALKYRAAA